jgi:hypothetical protein
MPGTEENGLDFNNYTDLAEDTGRFIGRNAGFIEHGVGTVSDLVMWRFDLVQDRRRRGPGQIWTQAVACSSDHIFRPAAWRHCGIAALDEASIYIYGNQICPSWGFHSSFHEVVHILL